MYDEHSMRRTTYFIENHEISFCRFSEKNKKYLLAKRLDTTVVESRTLDMVPHKIFANIFKLLNSGGKVLGPQEVRNGIYWKNGDQEIARLSNSEAAKMRLIMEIMLAQEKGCHSVIIDEFDSHFDNVTMVDFMNQISEKFSNMRFLFVIHNFESLVQIWNMKAVIFNMSCTPGTYEHVIDTNDISQIGDAYKTFNKYLGRKKETEIFLSDCLSDFMENDKLSEESIFDIQKLNRKELNKREKIIYDYLKEKYEK